MSVCLICLAPTQNSPAYHADCLQTLFGTTTLPRLELSLPNLLRFATDMAGKMSISGMQEKVSLRLSEDRAQLQLALSGGRFILKPSPSRFTFVPENEHLTMCLARQMGIEVPPCGLIQTQEGSIAYLIKRFDREEDGRKLPVEDFCQLWAHPHRDKYAGSGELCVRILRQWATEPREEIQKLFQQLLFSWWVSNGDQHLKNFSLYTTTGARRLTPAYDLLCTRLPIPGDRSLAMTICGKKSNLTRKLWLDFSQYCQLPEATALQLLEDQIRALEPALELVRSSYLPDELKSEYEQILRENTAILMERPNP